MEKNISSDAANWLASKIDGFSFHQLIDEKNGGLKFIKIKPGSNYPIHQHPNTTEFALVVNGEAVITKNDEEFISKTGEVVIFPNGIKHALANKSNNDVILLVGAIQN
ncbi:MAG: cupin domain-containing protein [Bacteroidia bacterium]